MAYVDRFPSRHHPLCTCPEITFRNMGQPVQQSAVPCPIHIVLSTQDTDLLLANVRETLRRKGSDGEAFRA